MADKVNPFQSFIGTMERAAKIMGLTEESYIRLKSCERELTVAIPVVMDDGSLKVFQGYRVQHCTERGPGKGGIRYHQDSDIDEVRALAAWTFLTSPVMAFAGQLRAQRVQPLHFSGSIV